MHDRQRLLETAITGRKPHQGGGDVTFCQHVAGGNRDI